MNNKTKNLLVAVAIIAMTTSFYLERISNEKQSKTNNRRPRMDINKHNLYTCNNRSNTHDNKSCLVLRNYGGNNAVIYSGTNNCILDFKETSRTQANKKATQGTELLATTINKIENHRRKIEMKKSLKELFDSYIDDRLSFIEPRTTNDIMLRILYNYDYPFIKMDDKVIEDNVQSIRFKYFHDDYKFFNIQFSDIILIFAEQAAFDLGQNENYWIGVFLDNLGLSPYSSAYEINKIVMAIANGSYYHTMDDEDVLGMFSIPYDSDTYDNYDGLYDEYNEFKDIHNNDNSDFDEAYYDDDDDNLTPDDF